MPQHSSLLDYQGALRAVAGNKQLAHKLLAIFIEQLPEYQSNIKAYVTSSNFLELQNCIHKLNSASQYLGIPSLKQSVSDLDGHIETLSKQANSLLLDKITSLQQLIEQIMIEETYS